MDTVEGLALLKVVEVVLVLDGMMVESVNDVEVTTPEVVTDDEDGDVVEPGDVAVVTGRVDEIVVVVTGRVDEVGFDVSVELDLLSTGIGIA